MMDKLVLHVGIDRMPKLQLKSTNYSLLLQNYCYFYMKLVPHHDPNQLYVQTSYCVFDLGFVYIRSG